MAFTAKGALVTWADDHESAGHDHAYAVLLDSAMRAAGPAARRDARERRSRAASALCRRRPGRHRLRRHARPRSRTSRALARRRRAHRRRAARRSPREAGRAGGSLDRASTGRRLFGSPGKTTDKPTRAISYLRHLSAELEPIGSELRATDYVPARLANRGSGLPRSASLAGSLHVAFRFEREPLTW